MTSTKYDLKKNPHEQIKSQRFTNFKTGVSKTSTKLTNWINTSKTSQNAIMYVIVTSIELVNVSHSKPR